MDKKKFPVIMENYENDCLRTIKGIISPYSEMTNLEKLFLNGIVRYLKPKKTLEIGVSAGGGSAIILNAIHDTTESKLISVDYSDQYYRDKTKKTGFVISQYFPEYLEQWKLFTGGDVSNFINDIGGNFDLVVIDTAHTHPWESLNFLTVFPLIKDGGWVVLHDIAYYLSGKKGFACKYLYDHITSENKIRPLSEPVSYIFPNIGAFQITSDTHKYIEDVFMSLALPWDTVINKEELTKISDVIRINYTDDLVNLFNDAIAAQYIYMSALKEKGRIPFVRDFTRIFHLKLYAFLKKIKQKM